MKTKEFRQKINDSISNISYNFTEWKDSHLKNMIKKFPTPKMEISTNHLLEKDIEINRKSEMTTKMMLKFRLVWLAVVVLGYMMYNSLDYIYMVISAFILSLALEWVVIFWQRLSKSRWVWLFITYLLASLFVLSWFIILVPFFFNLWTKILENLMIFLNNIEHTIMTLGISGYIDQINWLPWFIKEELIIRIKNSNTEDLIWIIHNNIWNIMSTSGDYVKIIASWSLNIFSNFFAMVWEFAIILTLCIFFSISLYDLKYMAKYVLRHYPIARSRIDAAYSWISNRLRSQLWLCFFIWITSYIWLRLLEIFGIHIPQKWTLALLAGLFEIIPYIWPFLWAIPAALSALIFTGWWWVFAIIVLYTIIQQWEEKILVPIIMGKTLWVSPLLVFICMLVCGNIMGFLWVLLAVPIAVIIGIALELPKIEENNEEKEVWLWTTKKIRARTTKSKLAWLNLLWKKK